MNGTSSNVAAVWKLDASELNEDDLIDPDELLEPSDLVKPDPASLKVKKPECLLISVCTIRDIERKKLIHGPY